MPPKGMMMHPNMKREGSPPTGTAPEKDSRRDPMLEVDEAFNQWEYVVEQRLREQAEAAGPSASMFEHSVSGMDLIAMQQDEAHRLIDSIRNFAVNHNQDPGDMLDEIYTRMTGLERTRPSPPSEPYVAPATPTPPIPPPVDATMVPVPDFTIPNDTLISWGKMSGQPMDQLHTDLGYVKWLFGNRFRFKNPEALMVLQYLDQFYTVEGPKGKTYLRKLGETEASRSPVVRLPRRAPPARVGLAEALLGSSTTPARPATSTGNDMDDLVKALLTWLSRGS